MSKEKSSIGFGLGLLTGVIGGIVAGILYAPCPGSEMRERLEKAGVKNIKEIPKIKDAVKHISKYADEDITILTTYTALLKIDKIKEIKKCY
jgi:gas vesicle protein